MTSRARIRRALALTLVLLLVPTALARGDAAYDRVATAYGASGGQLDPCSFTQEDLQAGLDGIPSELREVVPALRRAIEDGIRAHKDGDCEGVAPTAGAPTTTPGAATPPVTTPDAAATPPATTPAPDAAAPAPGATTAPAAAAPVPAADGTLTTPAVQQPGVARDRKPLLVGLAALGALLLLALLLWGVARLRGWDSAWGARTRHAWGEAGYRVSSTWSEFTDWLRLGR